MIHTIYVSAESLGWIQKYDIFLDGKKLDRVVEADAVNGWVIVYEGIGDLMVGPPAKKIFGKVEIIQKEAQPHAT